MNEENAAPSETHLHFSNSRPVQSICWGSILDPPSDVSDTVLAMNARSNARCVTATVDM